jgi:hypothetical protein
MSATVLAKQWAPHALFCLTLLACGAPDSASRPAPKPTGVSSSDQITAEGGCVDNVLCVIGDRWDPVLCTCVPDQDAATQGSPDVCIETVLCIRADHFDPQLCRCVPNDDAGEPDEADNGESGCTGGM